MTSLALIFPIVETPTIGFFLIVFVITLTSTVVAFCLITSANKVLYNATLKPIVDKIEELPQAQQEQLRKQICPIVDN
jgi:hypothetical protein